jgi:hypothetical protein
VPLVEFMTKLVDPTFAPGGGTIWLRLRVTLLVQKEKYTGPFDPVHVVAQTMVAEWELTAVTVGMKVGAMKPSAKEMHITAEV